MPDTKPQNELDISKSAQKILRNARLLREEHKFKQQKNYKK